MSEARPAIWVTEIGEYIRQRSCERRFKLEVNRREVARQRPFASRLFAPLDPVLAEMGRQRENTWEASLRKAALWGEVKDRLDSPGTGQESGMESDAP